MTISPMTLRDSDRHLGMDQVFPHDRISCGARGPTPAAERIVDLAMCEPVAMGILSGATDDAHAKFERLANGLPSLAIDPTVDFRTAAQIYRAARRSG